MCNTKEGKNLKATLKQSFGHGLKKPTREGKLLTSERAHNVVVKEEPKTATPFAHRPKEN